MNKHISEQLDKLIVEKIPEIIGVFNECNKEETSRSGEKKPLVEALNIIELKDRDKSQAVEVKLTNGKTGVYKMPEFLLSNSCYSRYALLNNEDVITSLRDIWTGYEGIIGKVDVEIRKDIPKPVKEIYKKIMSYIPIEDVGLAKYIRDAVNEVYDLKAEYAEWLNPVNEMFEEVLEKCFKKVNIFGKYIIDDNRIILYVRQAEIQCERKNLELEVVLSSILAHEFFHCLQYFVIATYRSNPKAYWNKKGLTTEGKCVIEGLAKNFEICWLNHIYGDADAAFEAKNKLVFDDFRKCGMPGEPYAAARYIEFPFQTFGTCIKSSWNAAYKKMEKSMLKEEADKAIH